MKNFIFPFQADRPKYVQIYEQLKLCIEQGYLKPHELLPPIRQLATSLQVSRNTTLTSYEQLLAEGYIRSEQRKGYFVNPIESVPTIDYELIQAKNVSSKIAVQIDFRAGAVDQQHFPLAKWRKLMYQALTQTDAFQYGNVFGELELREQISRYLLQSRGVKTTPEAIIIGSSTQQLLLYLIQLLKETYSHILVEDPGYLGAKEVFLFHQLELETLPIYEHGYNLTKLHTYKAKLVYVTPSHQSPLGSNMSIQQRHQLINWANDCDGYIIEDDYDSEFRYSAKPFPALASINQQRIIYLGNFSKSFLPGIRLSYAVLPAPLIAPFKEMFQYFECNTSIINQFTMTQFMKQGEWDRHIKRMRIIYKRKMHYIVDALHINFQKTITIIGQQSGLYVLIKVHLLYDEQTLIELALKQGVKVYPTSLFYTHNISSEPIIKLGFSTLTCEEIKEGITRLKQAWLLF